MRTVIKKIINAAGTVSFPYKRTLADHMGEATLAVAFLPGKGPLYVIDSPTCLENFDLLPEALDEFMKLVFNRKNLGLAYRGILLHGLADNTHDLPDSTLRKLIKQYFADYFHKDYPFAE